MDVGCPAPYSEVYKKEDVEVEGEVDNGGYEGLAVFLEEIC